MLLAFSRRAQRPPLFQSVATAVRWFRSGVSVDRKRARPIASTPWSPFHHCSRRAASTKPVIPFVLADIGEGISEVTVKEWFVVVGDRVTEFDDVCEVESDKATVTITSRYTGVVTKLYHEIGSLAKVGSPLIDIEIEEHGTSATDGTVEIEAVSETGAVVETGAVAETRAEQEPRRQRVLTTPAVRRIAAEKGIDLATIKGTGKEGRVLKEDVLDLAELPPSTSAEPPSTLAEPPTDRTGFVPLSGYAKAMRHSMEASNSIPALVITDEVNLTRLVEFKAQLVPYARLTLLPFLIKATSLTLARHPRVNATPSADYMAYRLNADHNIGVAIDTSLGLAVPNLKAVQTLSVREIGRRLAELRDRAGRGKLTPADVTGGTFTLSNMGSIAGSVFHPMILPPELAIGALGRIKYRSRYDAQHQLVRTPVMNVSWAADHRLLDGATVARFFKDWKTYVENPALIVTEAELLE